MFKESDVVLYGIQGVCVVKGTVEKGFGDEAARYYVLSPVFSPSSNIFVPIDNEVLTARMKPVLDAEEAENILQELPELETIWIADEDSRKKTYKSILQEGDRRTISAMIKTLYLHRQAQKSKGKSLHQCDERCLRDAEKMLFSEFALLLHKHPAEMEDYFASQIS
jgi:CarD family transcriptional regulator